MKIVSPEIVQYVDSGHGCAHGCCSSGALVAVSSQDMAVRLRREKTRQYPVATTTPFSQEYLPIAALVQHRCTWNCPASLKISQLPPLATACWLLRWPVS